jgi:hypothetical protein
MSNAMIEITTKSSMSVKPDRRLACGVCTRNPSGAERLLTEVCTTAIGPTTEEAVESGHQAALDRLATLHRGWPKGFPS